MEMDIKEIMRHDVITFRDKAEYGLGRIESLLNGLEHARETIDSIEEADTKEALLDAYEKLQEAFINTISAEQVNIMTEVRK